MAFSSGVATCHSWPSLAWLYCAVSFALENARMKCRRPQSCRTYANSPGRAPLTVKPYFSASRLALRPSSADGGLLRATPPSWVVSLTVKNSRLHNAQPVAGAAKADRVPVRMNTAHGLRGEPLRSPAAGPAWSAATPYATAWGAGV